MKRSRMGSIIFAGLILARAAIFAGVNVTNIGPEGGTFRSLVVGPQDPRTLYAGHAPPEYSRASMAERTGVTPDCPGSLR